MRTIIAFVVLGLSFVLSVHAADPTPQPEKLSEKGKPQPPLKQIVIVFKTHFDIGYSAMAKDVVQKYRTTMIDNTLAVIDKNRDLPKDRQFVWTVPGWPMAQMLWSGQDPQRKKKIEQAFRDGNLAVHALPFTTHTETLELEDFVRGLGFSSRLAGGYGLELPRAAKMTDVPCHTWVLSTLLKHAGVDFLQIGCGDANEAAAVPSLFWWEGPDGSRLLTMYSQTYGTSLLPPANWPYATWLALLMTYDNVGPPQPEYVKQVLADLSKQAPHVKVKIGQLSDFSDALLAEKPDLPVVRGDMPDTWIHGPMSASAGCKIARNIRPMIAAAEGLSTLSKIWGLNVSDTPATKKLPHAVSITLTLYRDLPVADLAVSFEKKPDGWPETGWICLPLKIDPPTFRLGRLGSIIDPTTDIIEGCNFHQLWLNSGLTVNDLTGAGVGLCPIDSPLVSLGEPGIMRYSRRYVPKQAHVYVNLFNNQYHTNFRSWWGGSLSSRVRLWSFDKYDATGSLYQPAIEARTPLLAAESDGPAGMLPVTQSGLELSRGGVAVTAFGSNPDGSGILLRLWEQAGQNDICTVRVPTAMSVSSVQPVDLRGRPSGAPIPVNNGTFNIPLQSFAPTSFVIRTD